MSDEQFAKLFRYFEDFRREVNERFDKHDREFANIYSMMAELSAEVKDIRYELATLSYQVGKGHTAIRELAAGTGIRLSVEL